MVGDATQPQHALGQHLVGVLRGVGHNVEDVLHEGQRDLRDEDLRAHGHSGYRVCTTVFIPNGDYVMIVDTLEREEIQQ